MEQLNRKQYNSIDLFKLIFSFAVIAIHTEPFHNCTIEWIVRINKVVTGLAVPFFFISAGFLLGNKLSLDYEKVEKDVLILKKYLKRILKMYLIWMLIYMPLAISHYSLSGYTFIKGLAYYVNGLIFVGEQYNNWVLWYLLSTVYVILLLLIIIKKNNSFKPLTSILLTISVVASIIVVVFGFVGHLQSETHGILGSGQKVVSMVFSSGRIFNGFIYIPIGIVLSKKSIPTTYCICFFCVGIIGKFVMIDKYISLYPLIISSVGLFELILRLNLSNKVLYSVMRKMSTTVFLIHLYIWTAYYMVVYGTKTYGADSFIVVSMVSALISIFVWIVYNKNKKENINSVL